jgi:ferrous iron transport protein A
MMPLSQLERGLESEITQISGGDLLAQRLMAMGFLPGARLRVAQVAPFGDPIAVDLTGSRISLRRREASQVMVRPV